MEHNYSLTEVRAMSLQERAAKLPDAVVVDDISTLTKQDRNWAESCIKSFTQKVLRAEEATKRAYAVSRETASN